MATYQELKAQAEALAAQAEQARLAELEEAIAQVQKLVRDYGLTPEQVFGPEFVAQFAAQGDQESDEHVEETPRQPQAATKTALNPAAAWPFPCGSRP